MKSTDKTSLTVVQMNDTHAYFDIHQEMFWQGDHAEYRQAGGYARIATIVKLEENLERTFSCDANNQMGGYLKRK